MKILRPWYWIAFATLFAVLDQASKAVIEIWLPLHNSMPVAENFNLVHVLNPGAAFSFLADQAGCISSSGSASLSPSASLIKAGRCSS